MPGPSVYGGAFVPTVDSAAQAAAEGQLIGKPYPAICMFVSCMSRRFCSKIVLLVHMMSQHRCLSENSCSAQPGTTQHADTASVVLCVYLHACMFAYMIPIASVTNCTMQPYCLMPSTLRTSSSCPAVLIPKKKKNFTSFGQPTRLITCANHGNTVICS